QFKQLLAELGKHLVKQKPNTVEEALQQKLHGEGETVENYINSAVSTIGEKISLRRFEILEKADDDVFGTYMHMGGHSGVLRLLERRTDENVDSDLSMHVAAIHPSYMSSDDVAEDEGNYEPVLLKTQALTHGKPETTVAQMVEGRLGTFFHE